MSTGWNATSRHQGTVEQLPSGAWRAKIYGGVDPSTRRRMYLTETVPAGPQAEKEAHKALRRLKNQIDERLNPRTRRTLKQLLDEYLAVANLDPGTLRGYQRNRRNHVDPLLGSKQISSIDARELEGFYAELRRCRKHCDGTRQIEHRTGQPHQCDASCSPHQCESLSPSTIRRIHFLLSGAFKRAVRWHWISVNPCTAAEPPPERKPEPQPPTPEQAAQILNTAWEDPDWGAFIWLAMTTGARRAELCALRWKDLDLSHGSITVARSIDQHGGQAREKATKTHQHRRIALDVETTAVLQDHHDRCSERVQDLGIPLDKDAFVFSLAPDGSEPFKPDTITQRYGRLVKRLKLTTTFHKLRHFSATELIAAGVDPRTVSGRLGHAGGGATTLRVYSAWVSESDQRAATSLATRMPSRLHSIESSAPRTTPRHPTRRSRPRFAARYSTATSGRAIPPPHRSRSNTSTTFSAGTANRVVELLRQWHLVEASRGRRAIVLAPQESQPVETSDRADHATDGPGLLDLRLMHLGKQVRAFTAEADSNDPTQLQRLLRNAARRHDQGAELADYELEVRRPGRDEVLLTFAAT